MRCAIKPKLRQHGNHLKKACKKENKMILWFEIDDTGCGMNPKNCLKPHKISSISIAFVTVFFFFFFAYLQELIQANGSLYSKALNKLIHQQLDCK
jgi:hypothetical protein